MRARERLRLRVPDFASVWKSVNQDDRFAVRTIDARGKLDAVVY